MNHLVIVVASIIIALIYLMLMKKDTVNHNASRCPRPYENNVRNPDSDFLSGLILQRLLGRILSADRLMPDRKI